jgi:serpin B
LHKVGADNAGKNLVFSPLSISTALAMTYAGARGATEAEMKQTLHFELEQPALHEAFNAVDLALSSRGEGKAGADGTPFRLNVNNSIWAQQGFTVVPAFLDTLALNYGAGVFLTDFASDAEGSRKAINGWVAQKTEDLIPELLPMGSIGGDTVMVLTNTVYFNASWKVKFEKEQTQQAPFKKLDGSSVQVSMMNAGLQGVASYAKGDRYEAVALPYASEELSFLAILPDPGAYEAVEAAANAQWFAALQTKLAPSGVQLALPKLDTKTATSLRPALMALGMNLPFSGADFSGLTPSSVEIDNVIHEAVLKLFEGGTIAAAATAVTIREVSIPLFEHTVRFDRPFLYAIVDKPTGHVLFLGRVLDPSVP